MKKNSPRKKNVSKKRNTSKKKSYPEANYITETGATKKTNKKRYTKKKKNKVDFKEYLRKKAKDAWGARDIIIFVAVMLGFFASIHFMTNYNPGNESAICTVTSVEIVEHEDPYWTSGEFETEECGIITSSKSPDGIPIRKYLQNFKTGKKYRAYKSLLTRNDEFDFSVLRFEEIKE
ncbi:hypothetical protein [uncultured Rothia sp.]|uniref:hypothetical protein n=1 Tax=uncultured Rothia sp. TaxID=316088 RepID=UPI00288C6274|nr:hypothetical protein [uncultured Rothia sp.]